MNAREIWSFFKEIFDERGQDKVAQIAAALAYYAAFSLAPGAGHRHRRRRGRFRTGGGGGPSGRPDRRVRGGVPDAKAAWKDVIIGALFTALLFTIGQFLLGLYLARGAFSSTYGAAGSFLVILLWVYYSAQILLLGAEFTQVYARRYGSRIRPSDEGKAAS